MLNSFIFAAIDYSKVISVLEKIHSCVFILFIPAAIILVASMLIITFIHIMY